MKTTPLFLMFATGLGVAACVESTAPEGPAVEIKIAPISYPGISDVCYDLTVLNGEPTPDDADPTNEPDVVWSKSGICSGNYGNAAGGDISYVGPCDAGVDDNNYVQLTLADVYAGGASPLLDQLDAAPEGDADYENPCPTGDPCTLDFECRENEDQLVVFNLTIMRDANQGFFDIAVNFEDVFCSAKLDTCYEVTASQIATADFDGVTYYVYRWVEAPIDTPEWQTLGYAKHSSGPEWNMYRFDADPSDSNNAQSPSIWRTFGHTSDPTDPKEEVVITVADQTVTLHLEGSGGTGTPITLLHDASGERRHTAVMALACTGGPTEPPVEGDPAADLTHLYLDAIVITCGDEITTLDPSAGPAGGGNVYSATTTPQLGLASSGEVWQYAVYAGQEGLGCGDGPGSCDKVYWNVAIGIEGLPAGCTLSAAASASAGQLQYELAPGFGVPGTTPKATTYPVVLFDEIPLTDADGVICAQHPLNGGDGMVRTHYTEIGMPHDFGFELVQIAGGGVARGALDDDDSPTGAAEYSVPLLAAEGNLQKIVGQVGAALALDSPNFDHVDLFRLTVSDAQTQAAFACDSDIGARELRPRMNVYSASGAKLFGPVECGEGSAYARKTKPGDAYFVALIAPATGSALQYDFGFGALPDDPTEPQGVWVCGIGSDGTGHCICGSVTCSEEDPRIFL